MNAPDPNAIAVQLRAYAKDWRDRAASADLPNQAADLLESQATRIAELGRYHTSRTQDGRVG